MVRSREKTTIQINIYLAKQKKPATKLPTASETLLTGDVPDITDDTNQNNVVRFLRVDSLNY